MKPLVKERYLPHCSFYHEHGMPEDMEKLVMSVGYQRGSITEHQCFFLRQERSLLLSSSDV